MEKGTLYHIRNLIGRRNNSNYPKNDVNAFEDFFEAVIFSHILTAVLTYLDMSTLDDSSSTPTLSQNVWMTDDANRCEIRTDISTAIVDNFVDLATTFKLLHLVDHKEMAQCMSMPVRY